MNEQLLQSSSDGSRYSNTVIALSVALLPVAGLTVKACMAADWISILVAVIYDAVWLFLCVCVGDKMYDGKEIPDWCHSAVLHWLLTACLTLLSLPFGSGPHWINQGLRIYTGAFETKKVAFPGDFVAMMPFTWTYYVPERIDQYGIAGDFGMKDKEGIDVRCTVTATGIVLDRRDPARLEQVLLQMVGMQGGDPFIYMRDRLRVTLIVSASRFVSGEKSGSEQYIQSEIGKDVGATMWVLGLTWRFGGGISGPRCRVVHSN